MTIQSKATLLEAIQHGLPVKYLFFWGDRPPRQGVSKTCLSQWYAAPFTLNGIRYPTAEHFMMAEKARLFEDQDTEARVLAAAHPGEAKALGRRVAGFEEGLWEAERWRIVVTGNQAKFSQNPELGDFLHHTGQRILVEASPLDRIWGNGLAANHPAAEQPEQWPGLNLLGFALMAVRAQQVSS